MDGLQQSAGRMEVRIVVADNSYLFDHTAVVACVASIVAAHAVPEGTRPPDYYMSHSAAVPGQPETLVGFGRN